MKAMFIDIAVDKTGASFVGSIDTRAAGMADFLQRFPDTEVEERA